MGSCFKSFVLICIVGCSTATNVSSDDFHEPHVGLRKNEAERADNDQISWSSQTPSLDLATRDVNMKERPMESKSFTGNPASSGLHVEMKNTMHPTDQTKFIPRRETSPHVRVEDSSSNSSSNSSSSSSSSESKEDKPKKNKSLKRHNYGKKYSPYPSPSFHRGTQSPYEKRDQRHSLHANNGYGYGPHRNRYDEYAAQHPEEYGQYGQHRAGSRRRYSGNEYQKFNQKPYALSYHDQPAGMNMLPPTPPLMAH